MKSLFEEVNIGDVVTLTVEEPDIESGQSIETTVLGKFTRRGALSLVVDLSGISFCMADPFETDLIELDKRVRIVSTLNGGFKIIGESSFGWAEWSVSISQKTLTRRRTVQ